MPELTDVFIGVSVGAVLEVARRVSARKAGGYLVYREYAERAESLEQNLQQELRSLKLQVDALHSELTEKRDMQAIADSLTVWHAKGIGIFNREYDGSWRPNVAQFLSELLPDMRELGCTDQEIHAVQNVGVIPAEGVQQLDRHDAIRRERTAFLFRLNALGGVSTSYAQRAERRR